MKQSLKFSKKELDQEKWALIEGTKGYYISNLGRVKRKYKTRERMLTPYFKSSAKKSANKKTLFIKIMLDNGKRKELAVHHLVAKYFLPPQPKGWICWHKNGVLTDNRHVNLQWIHPQVLGKKTGWRTQKVRGIYKICPETKEILDYYRSSREAAKANYCSYQTIIDSCNGKTKWNCTGYLFRWSDQRGVI